MEEVHFTITVDHQRVWVRVRPQYIAKFLVHFEFRSPFEPAQRIPMSSTGYLSHFAYAWQLEGCESLEAFALELGTALIAAECHHQQPRDEEQGELF